jgi:hypothetical protein
MATARQIAANRRNARRSPGPRSRAGRKRSSRNSFRHGLAAGVITNGGRIKWVERLAREIAGAGADIVTLECARSIAQAEFDLAQVRRVKLTVMSRIAALGGFQTSDASRSQDQQTRCDVDRVETAAMPMTPSDGTAAEEIRTALSELTKLDRYEQRAATRRERAVHILLDRKIG